MIKVDLISKRRKASKGKNWTKLIGYALLILCSAGFVGATLYVIISMAVLNNQISRADTESKKISAEMLKNSDKINRFVMTKLILTEIQDVNKDRFRYKDYLDEAQKIFPSSVSITAVDFAVKGWLSISVSCPDYFAFRAVENVLLNRETWANNSYFTNAYIDSINRDKAGLYSYRLKFELKKINGTAK